MAEPPEHRSRLAPRPPPPPPPGGTSSSPSPPPSYETLSLTPPPPLRNKRTLQPELVPHVPPVDSAPMAAPPLPSPLCPRIHFSPPATRYLSPPYHRPYPDPASSLHASTCANANVLCAPMQPSPPRTRCDASPPLLMATPNRRVGDRARHPRTEEPQRRGRLSCRSRVDVRGRLRVRARRTRRRRRGRRPLRPRRRPAVVLRPTGRRLHAVAVPAVGDPRWTDVQLVIPRVVTLLLGMSASR